MAISRPATVIGSRQFISAVKGIGVGRLGGDVARNRVLGGDPANKFSQIECGNSSQGSACRRHYYLLSDHGKRSNRSGASRQSAGLSPRAVSPAASDRLPRKRLHFAGAKPCPPQRCTVGHAPPAMSMRLKLAPRRAAG
jgi:hypothetical protein